MLPAHDWTEDAIAALGRDEHDFQEFKGTGWLWDGKDVTADFHTALSKQVSAFANGGGGRILLGLDDHGVIDGGVPREIRRGGTRSWLEDVVPGLVDPPLARFNVHEVLPAGPDSRLLPGHAVYVIEVPASDSAPHQALDLRYYLRIAGKSRPMGHVHIQDILRRTHFPRVALHRLVPFGPEEHITTDPRGPKVMIGLRAHVVNEGRTLAHHVGVEVVLPRPFVNRESRSRTLKEGDVSLTQRPGTVNFFRYHPNPVFPSQHLAFLSFWGVIHHGNLDAVRAGVARPQWRIYADDAPAREGTIALHEFAVVREAVAWLVGQRAG